MFTLSMRKVDGREDMGKQKDNNDGDSGHYVIASQPPNGNRMQHRRSCQWSLFRFNGEYLRKYKKEILGKNTALCTLKIVID